MILELFERGEIKRLAFGLHVGAERTAFAWPFMKAQAEPLEVVEDALCSVELVVFDGAQSTIDEFVEIRCVALGHGAQH